MAEASRQFDIGWLDDTTAKSAPGPDTSVLRVLATRNGPEHVVDVAKELDLDFVDTLRAVLQLASDDYLTIVKRDDMVGDHLVELSPRGRQALETA